MVPNHYQCYPVVVAAGFCLCAVVMTEGMQYKMHFSWIKRPFLPEFLFRTIYLLLHFDTVGWESGRASGL